MYKKVFVLTALLVISSTPLFAVQRVVLAEDFTGTWCQYCPGAQMGLQILQGQVGDSLAILAYHSSDPFTIPEYGIRASYYGVSGIPHVRIDGVLSRIGGYYNQPVNYRDLYDIRQAIPAPVQISLSNATFNPLSGSGVVSVSVNNVSTGNIAGNLRLAMVGKDTTYSWQSQTHLYDVVLGMFPNAAAGEAISLHASETFSNNYNYTIPVGWRGMSCAVVAFLQDDVTKEVYNASEADTRAGIEEKNQELLIINNLTFSNPLTKKAKFYFNAPKTEGLSLSIYDVSGMLVKTFNNFSGKNEIVWDLNDTRGRTVKSGIYFVTCDFQDQTTIHKLVIAK